MCGKGLAPWDTRGSRSEKAIMRGRGAAVQTAFAAVQTAFETDGFKYTYPEGGRWRTRVCVPVKAKRSKGLKKNGRGGVKNWVCTVA
jgi:hypothetical protein